MSSSVYAADVQLSSGSQINTGDLNCLQLQKHAGKKSFCLPSKNLKVAQQKIMIN